MRIPKALLTHLTDSRYRAAAALKRYPRVYLPFIAARKRDFDGSSMGFTAATELVIDAYPRSGNSFATRAFLYCQRRPVALAHHLHAPAAIVAGVRRGLPVLTILRKPADAVVSLAVYRSCEGYDRRQNVRRALTDYIGYYQCILPCRESIVVASFEAVVRDFGAVTTSLNDRFDKRFDVFNHTPENVAAVNAQLGVAHAWWTKRYKMDPQGPTDPRPDSRRAAEQQMFRELYLSPDCKARRARAEEVYQQFVRSIDQKIAA